MIKCTCIDDSNRPVLFPEDKWIKKGNTYTITKVFELADETEFGISLLEINTINDSIYNGFKLSRFAFEESDLIELMQIIELALGKDKLEKYPGINTIVNALDLVTKSIEDL